MEGSFGSWCTVYPFHVNMAIVELHYQIEIFPRLYRHLSPHTILNTRLLRSVGVSITEQLNPLGLGVFTSFFKRTSSILLRHRVTKVLHAPAKHRPPIRSTAITDFTHRSPHTMASEEIVLGSNALCILIQSSSASDPGNVIAIGDKVEGMGIEMIQVDRRIDGHVRKSSTKSGDGD